MLFLGFTEVFHTQSSSVYATNMLKNRRDMDTRARGNNVLSEIRDIRTVKLPHNGRDAIVFFNAHKNKSPKKWARLDWSTLHLTRPRSSSSRKPSICKGKSSDLEHKRVSKSSKYVHSNPCPTNISRGINVRVNFRHARPFGGQTIK